MDQGGESRERTGAGGAKLRKSWVGETAGPLCTLWLLGQGDASSTRYRCARFRGPGPVVSGNSRERRPISCPQGLE